MLLPFRRLSFATVSLALSPFSYSQTVSNPDILFFQDFDHRQQGSYSTAMIPTDWGTTWSKNVDKGHVKVTSGRKAFYGNALEVKYPAGVGASNSGASWRTLISGNHDELYLSYRVRFGDGIDFVYGGKLPGFAGGTAPTGGTNVTGADGFSARYMWRAQIEGSWASGLGVADLCSYVYHKDKPGFYGENFFWTQPNNARLRVSPGKWYQIESRVKMNDPGVRNGIMQVWVDGVMASNVTDICWRTVNTIHIDQMYFSTFYGGGNSWGPPKDEFIYFDDFVISTKPIGTTYDDSDGDGIRDSWEQTNFGNVTTANATSDADADGRTDLSEYHFGTSPLNGNDNGSITLATPSAASPALNLSWMAKSQLWYQLEKSSNLKDWETVQNYGEGSDAIINRSIMIPANEGNAIYRLKIERQ